MSITNTSAATGKELIEATQNAVMNAANNVGSMIEEVHAPLPHAEPFYMEAEFWVGLAFVTVVIALARPIGRILSSMIHKRIENIRQRIDESEELLEDAQKLLSEYERKYHNAKKEAQAIVEKSQKQINYIKTENLCKLEQDMKNKEKDAADRIHASQENADRELASLMSQTTIQIVKQAVNDNLSAKAQDKLIDNSISLIGRMKP